MQGEFRKKWQTISDRAFKFPHKASWEFASLETEKGDSTQRASSKGSDGVLRPAGFATGQIYNHVVKVEIHTEILRGENEDRK